MSSKWAKKSPQPKSNAASSARLGDLGRAFGEAIVNIFQSISKYIYVYIYECVYIYIYVYIYRSVNIYIYIVFHLS